MTPLRSRSDDWLVQRVREHGTMTAAARAEGYPDRSYRREMERRGLGDQVAALRGPQVSIDDIIVAVERTGSLRAATRALKVPWTSTYERLADSGRLGEAKALCHNQGRPDGPHAEQPGIAFDDDGDSVVLTTPIREIINPELGDVGDLIRERGLVPDEWVVTNIGMREWDALAAVKRGDEPRKVRMRQLRVSLRRAPHLLLVMPAQPHPRAPRSPGPAISQRPDHIAIVGDHQVPFQNEQIHIAFMAMLRTLSKRYRLTDIVHLGDLMELPTISRHADHPLTKSADVNLCIQGGHDVLDDIRTCAPGARIRLLKGNHDWRVEGELLLRAERMYGIRPARRGGVDETPALSLDRLLRLPELGIELIEDPRGWEHAEVEIVPGQHGLVIRHGWITGANTAAKSLARRGRSIIVGHIHKPESIYVYDASAGIARQAHALATMCHSRDRHYPNYVVEDQWLQGCGITTRWPDQVFEFDHVPWYKQALVWRDHRWS